MLIHKLLTRMKKNGILYERLNKCSIVQLMGASDILEFKMCSCTDAARHAADIMPGAEEINSVAELFRLCGDVTRVGILCALSRHELCVSDIASVLSMTSSAVSHQLRLMKQTGLVKSHRSGKTVLYSIADGHVEEIFSIALAHAEEKK